MFGRKKKVDLEEILQELAGDDEDERARVKRRLRVSDEDAGVEGVRFKVEFEGVEELIKEIRALRESISELTELLREQGGASVAKK